MTCDAELTAGQRARLEQGHCLHCTGPTEHEPDQDERNCAYYELPENRVAAGPARKREDAR